MISFREAEAVIDSSLSRGSLNLLSNGTSYVCRILEIYSYFYMHPGSNNRVNFSNFRLPSPFSAPHFFISFLISVNYFSDELIRASIANSLEITHGAAIYLRYWHLERSFSSFSLKFNCWEPIILYLRDAENSLRERFQG